MWFVRITLSALLVCACLAGFTTALPADELLAPDRPIEEIVDHYIDAGLTAAGVSAAPAADDANFIRRVTLDLAGRIPVTSEVQSFLQSAEPDKKARLVDRLLTSPDFGYHHRNDLDVMVRYSPLIEVTLDGLAA